jgi:6-pyruvoyltetrahydropterin/6-carboxytetrahydropterin synthase
MWTISKKFYFEAAHALPHLSEDHPCRNIHGHSYTVEIICKSGCLDSKGFVVDYAEIRHVVAPLIQKLDHQNLNEVLSFPTTSEHLAKWFYDETSKSLPVHSIKVFETSGTWACYLS